jgi:hypothetical protein
LTAQGFIRVVGSSIVTACWSVFASDRDPSEASPSLCVFSDGDDEAPWVLF